MLDKFQANVLAEKLLESERAHSREKSLQRVKRIPWYLRSSDLAALDAYQQAELVRAAQHFVVKAPSFYVAIALLFALVLGAWVFLPANVSVLVAPLFPVCVLLIRAIFVRCFLKILLARF